MQNAFVHTVTVFSKIETEIKKNFSRKDKEIDWKNEIKWLAMQKFTCSINLVFYRLFSILFFLHIIPSERSKIKFHEHARCSSHDTFPMSLTKMTAKFTFYFGFNWKLSVVNIHVYAHTHVHTHTHRRASCDKCCQRFNYHFISSFWPQFICPLPSGM